VLIFVEVALATVLLLAGAVMLRSWVALYAQDSGMDADRVIAVRAMPAPPADAVRRAAFNARVAEAVRHVPGVESVDLVDMPLLQRAVRGSSFVPPALVRHPAGMDTDVIVTPGYFATMGITVRMGRGLRNEDLGRGVVVSDALANRYWPGRNPVGEFIRYGDGTRQIVGVVSSARDVQLDGAPMPTLYHVWDEKAPPVATLVARFSGTAGPILPQIRAALRGVDPGAVVSMLATVEELLSTSVAERNFNTLLFAVFGAAGLLVALVGIYGLVAFIVARREREMGIRLALGASAGALKIFVMSGTLRWVAAGLACGVVLGLAFASSLKPFVYQIPPDDPKTLAGAAAAFLAVAAIATYLPARRAARVDPMIALRAE
jgi:predicted permease